MQSILGRSILLGGFVFIALLLFLPSTPLKTKLPQGLVDSMPKIALGLDLQGGMHLVINVDREDALNNYTNRLSDSIANILNDRKVTTLGVKQLSLTEVEIAYTDDANKKVIEGVMKEEYGFFETPRDENASLVYKIIDNEADRIRRNSVEQSLEILRNRIDKFGVTEPVIQRQGLDEIVIQLPGVKDTKRIIDIIGGRAVLEFKLLDTENDPVEAEVFGAPPGSEILYQKVVDPDTGDETKIPFLVYSHTYITGDLVTDARIIFDQTQGNRPSVSLSFDSEGAKIFARLTEQNVGKQLAIILDDNVYSAPRINERIGGGSASITGNFTYEEASDLAIVLRAGALPAKTEIVQTVVVGPTLGQDSIEAGLSAIILGGALVLVFMIVYYGVSGVIADIAVTLNVIMLLGAMAWANATLTLPGIAGIILTIGMGVDSNVLIFERIKEELRAGRTPRSAINGGYNRAWWTIVDSQLTTLITAMVLFQFGSGPIKGFAVTLSLGILTNLFTALIGTKLAFDIQSEKLRIKKLSI